MLGGRFQVPADEECPSCPVRPGGPSSPDEGLSQQSSWEGQSGVAFPPSGVPEPEERRPHGMSGPRKVSMRGGGLGTADGPCELLQCPSGPKESGAFKCAHP